MSWLLLVGRSSSRRSWSVADPPPHSVVRLAGKSTPSTCYRRVGRHRGITVSRKRQTRLARNAFEPQKHREHRDNAEKSYSVSSVPLRLSLNALLRSGLQNGRNHTGC